VASVEVVSLCDGMRSVGELDIEFAIKAGSYLAAVSADSVDGR
jgi:hypothetical protein